MHVNACVRVCAGLLVWYACLFALLILLSGVRLKHLNASGDA